MGCNCKGKQESNDLKYFRLLMNVATEINKRPIEKIQKELKIPSKAQMYKKFMEATETLKKVLDENL